MVHFLGVICMDRHVLFKIPLLIDKQKCFSLKQSNHATGNEKAYLSLYSEVHRAV